MNKKNITVIIVTYQGEHYIKSCIDSLLKQTHKSFNIVIVDNNSSDATKMMIKSYRQNNSNVYLIENRKNLGFAKANNIGIQFALNTLNADYLLLLNQDTVAANNLLDKLLYWSEKKETAAFGPKILIKKNNRIWWIGTKIYQITDLFKTPRLALSYQIDKEQEDYFFIDKPVQVEAIVGCALFLPSEIIENVGYLDEKFFMYGEDLDYSLRVRKKGYQLYVIPEATVYHDVHLESEALSAEKNLKKTITRYYLYFIGCLRVLHKHFSFLYAFIWILRIPFSVVYEILTRFKFSQRAF
jgi:GT2 family glycosyltransferase